MHDGPGTFRPQHPLTLGLAALALAACLSVPAVTARAAKQDEPPPAVKYAGQIEEELDLARRLRDAPGSIDGDYGKYGGFVKTDIARYREACEAHALVHDQIAAALKAGDIERVRALRATLEPLERACAVWKERIVDYRVKQAQAAPSEAWFRDETRWLNLPVMPELLAWGEARKLASEAWGRVAEAAVPGTDPNLIHRLRDDAYAAAAEEEIAEWRFTWAKQREGIWADKKVQSEELGQKLEALRKVQDRRVQLRRQDVERDRQSREIERQVRAAESDFRRAYHDAERSRQKAGQ